jgi:uncharacterized protein YecT (DUF1311 family)
MVKAFLALILGLVLQVAAVRADQCDAAQNQMQMTECAGLAFEKSDAELNSVYGELSGAYKKLDVATAKDFPKLELTGPALVTAQKSWIAFRDAECNLAGVGTQGGSIQSMIIIQCREQMTLERIKQLRQKLSCEEGDMSCVQLGDGAD